MTVAAVMAFRRFSSPSFFFFNDTATTEIYTLSLHDALPIYIDRVVFGFQTFSDKTAKRWIVFREDRKSTRLNSSHLVISYAVFCLKKKKKKICIGTATLQLAAERSLSHVAICHPTTSSSGTV